MATPILNYQPLGGVPITIPPVPPIYSQTGITALIEGQAYVDIVFGSIQTNADWVLVACEVENVSDTDPLNIWPGIITEKTIGGFRLQFNGMPDSGNYYLIWAISGINITPGPASTYYLMGPTSGDLGENVILTVMLPPSTFIDGSAIITLDDGGAGGVFTPSTVTLATASRSYFVTYTPVSYGVVTISAINDFGLIDPASLTLTVTAPTYTLTGPSGGDTGVASTNFTVELSGPPIGMVTVTPDDGVATGTFTPTSVALTAGSPSATFTYTPDTAGAKTISVTNDGGLANPASLIYTAAVVPIADGDPVSLWPDSSASANHAAQTGSARPIYKTNIINGKPVVRFTAAGLSKLDLTAPISATTGWVFFAVLKSSGPSDAVYPLSSSGSPSVSALNIGLAGTSVSDHTLVYYTGTTFTGAFHVFSTSTAIAGMYIDGTVLGLASAGNVTSDDFVNIGLSGSSYSDGDIAEIIIYSGVGFYGTDRANIEKYLGTKYGISVAGGSAVDPSTVTGLLGWWKADSIT